MSILLCYSFFLTFFCVCRVYVCIASMHVVRSIAFSGILCIFMEPRFGPGTSILLIVRAISKNVKQKQLALSVDCYCLARPAATAALLLMLMLLLLCVHFCCYFCGMRFPHLFRNENIKTKVCQLKLIFNTAYTHSTMYFLIIGVICCWRC